MGFAVVLSRAQREEAELRRLQHFKQLKRSAGIPLGDSMVSFFKHSVQKRQTHLTKIAGVFEQLVPAILLEHCALESFSRGALTVIVDSSPHLYELKQLLLSGLQKQIFLAAGSTGLRKINLKAGRWYTGEGTDQRLCF